MPTCILPLALGIESIEHGDRLAWARMGKVNSVSSLPNWASGGQGIWARLGIKTLPMPTPIGGHRLYAANKIRIGGNDDRLMISVERGA